VACWCIFVGARSLVSRSRSGSRYLLVSFIRETKWSRLRYRASLPSSYRRAGFTSLEISRILLCGTRSKAIKQWEPKARLVCCSLGRPKYPVKPGLSCVTFLSSPKICRYLEPVALQALLVFRGRLPKRAVVRSRNCRSAYVALLWGRKLGNTRNQRKELTEAPLLSTTTLSIGSIERS
jgi:hypothetical protein